MNIAEKISLWSMIGTWFSGIATVAAVLMAFHLANKRPKAIVKCTVSRSVFFIQNDTGTVTEKGIQIKVVNNGIYPITISSVEWEYGGDSVIANYFSDFKSHKLPARLEHGEVARFWIPLFPDERNWLKRLAKEIRHKGKNPSKVKCSIELTTGDKFKTKPDKEIIRILKQY
ncbi:TPA: hypothetical protein N3414_005665 [Klebsiella quasipneumoniae subsp. quasipneumoniae]|uniref:hypothetical protein n=1 Tax=Klebsiella pneumoniae complex TaxID=3390273 RepID=UPI0006524512|nr:MULTISPECIES: hypothetical protein [Klebsiella]HBW1846804.1 hypothetical protein [Klebsiella quasipneumoniae subsp. quasipneumoniae]EKU9430345.1 hypothetical protein [Klebsiella variicola]ELI0202793.1 hypothetical protein [Klebsiella pneumoniae]MCE0064722.1 hypothetical protein [Klebsiella pneumoniae]MCJ1841530.1 hypothetical protein [Klebsiella quasipneumoniae subsp. similipneumoniae]